MQDCRTVGKFESYKRFVCCRVAKLATQQLFSLSLGNFWNIKITVEWLNFTSVTLKLKILLISSMLFPFLISISYYCHFLWLTRSRNTVMQRAYSDRKSSAIWAWVKGKNSGVLGVGFIALTNWANKPTGSWSLNWFVIYPELLVLKGNVQPVCLRPIKILFTHNYHQGETRTLLVCHQHL